MAEEQFKRRTATKLRIGDILISKPIFDNEKFLFIELGERRITRVNVVGNIIDRFDQDGERKFTSLILDDGSGQLKLRIFGEDTEKFKELEPGQTVAVIGVTRNWNNETYVQPEAISVQDPKYLLVRKLEIDKERKETAKPIESKEEIVALKDKILTSIKESEDDGGIDTEQIIMNFRDISPDTINKEISKLLEEGIIFEPRPGRLRYLG